MSVQTFESIRIRPWRGYEDPGLPIGMWVAQAVLPGDATGGFQQIQLQFQEADQPLSGLFYNLEQLEIQVNANTSVPCEFTIIRFDTMGNTALANREYMLELVGTGGSGGSASMRPRDSLKGIFLGRPNALTIASHLSIIIDNVDGRTLTGTAQGYFWGPEALQAAGGLRRPVDALIN